MCTTYIKNTTFDVNFSECTLLGSLCNDTRKANLRTNLDS